MQIYEGEITDWNWVTRYGFATLENGNDVFVMTSQCLEVKKEGAKNFQFDGRPVEDCCKGLVWFDLYEKIWFTLSPEHPNVAVNISFTNNGYLTRLIAAGEPLPYSQAERKRLGLAGLVKLSLTSTTNSITSYVPQATLRILLTKKTMAGTCERFKRQRNPQPHCLIHQLSLLPEHQLSLKQKNNRNHRMLESHLVQIARQINYKRTRNLYIVCPV